MSNSDASEANSSSSSGSSFSRTSLTLTSKLACLPARLSGWWSSGNCDLDRHLVARRGARQRLVELRQQALGPQLDHQVGGLASPRTARRRRSPSSRSATRSPVGGGAVHGLQAREALAQPIELGLRPRRPGPPPRPCPPRAPCTRRASPRAGPPTSIENESSSPASGSDGTFSSGSPTGRDPGVQERPLVPLRERVAKRLLQHGLAADPLDHELRRDLALAKAGHAACRARARARRARAARSTASGSIPTSTRTRESPSSVTEVLIAA